jgi:hypothetical protein
MRPGEHVVLRSYPPDLGTNSFADRFNGGSDEFDIVQLRADDDLRPSPQIPNHHPLRRSAEPGQRRGAVLWRTTSSARSRCRPGREVVWERTAAILSSRMVTAPAPT